MLYKAGDTFVKNDIYDHAMFTIVSADKLTSTYSIYMYVGLTGSLSTPTFLRVDADVIERLIVDGGYSACELRETIKLISTIDEL